MLMTRAADGDRAALDPLFEALRPRAFRAAVRKLDRSRADDVAQAALERLFANASSFEAGRPVLPWFYAIVANEVRAELRRRPVADMPESAVQQGPPADEVSAEAELRAALAAAVAALDPVSAEAIAALLDERAPAVAAAAHRKRLSRAYARLRALLGGFADER